MSIPAIRLNLMKLHKEHVVLSEDGRYRYALYREVEQGLGSRADKAALFIMLNPSTADGKQDDPTIRRCYSFAYSLGCTFLYVVNLFAYRTPYPDVLFQDGIGGGDIIGPDNTEWIKHLAGIVKYKDDFTIPGPIIAAWGQYGAYMRQDETVCGWLDQYEMHCLGYCKNGQPRHPLMLPKNTQLEVFK